MRAIRLLSLLLAVPAALGAQASTAVWDSVAGILKTSVAPQTGYMRFNLPRRDITLRLGDVTVSPALALGTWAGFSGDPANATVMGDLVLLAAELKPVQAELARQEIAITAIHNHLAGEEPRITYVHFHAMGAATDIARRLDKVIALTATPRPVAAASPKPLTIDTATVFRVMGATGRAQGDVVQFSFMLVPGTVTMHGHVVTPALGYGSPVNIQAVSDTRLVATGDFSVPGEKVSPITRALAQNGITATAVHSHLVGETPAVYYIHFWADGPTADVLRGLRSALDAAR